MIEVADLKKRYGAITAVDGISFEVKEGEIFGLLGPNGAGKSTAIGMMAGYIKPDQGSVSVANSGSPVRASVRKNVGLSPQALALYEDLTAEENLAFSAKLYGLGGSKLAERVNWSLDLAGLQDRRKHAVKTFSGGMKRRLNIACALVHEPKVVFLDEPTVGVDPQSRNYIFESVERLRSEGLTVVYTTHYMEEAQRLCDRVAIIDHGKILALDTVEALIQAHGGGSLVIAELERIPENFAYVEGELIDSTLRISTMHPFQEVAKLAQMAVPMSSLRVDRPDLESVFLSLTGRSLRD
jgi:ABC-2 type transport system ATP-binding protein